MRRAVYFLAPIITLALMLAPIASTQQQLPLPTIGPTPSQPGDNRPNPDPSLLTTQQLIRELNSLREILTVTDLATEKTLVRLDKEIGRFASIIEQRIAGLQALHDERFTGIGLQFRERDARTEQTNISNQKATDAAFQAAEKGVFTAFQSAKEAASKSEAGFAKQFDQLINLFDTNFKALSSKIDDLKSRLGTLEGLGAGGRDYREASQASLGSVLGIVGAGISAFALIAMIFFNFIREHKNGNGNGNGNGK